MTHLCMACVAAPALAARSVSANALAPIAPGAAIAACAYAAGCAPACAIPCEEITLCLSFLHLCEQYQPCMHVPCFDA